VKPALFVVDVQKSFFHISPETARSLDSAIEYINAAVELFRKNGLPVICIQHVDENDHLVPGEEGFDIPESLNIAETDLRIHKHYGNAFNKTGLEAKLRELGVDTVLVTGFCAEYCVLNTCRGAADVDLTSMLLRSAIASATPANIPFVESICEVISYGALCKVLEVVAVAIQP
jgi:nicotinamidase-related amidase